MFPSICAFLFRSLRDIYIGHNRIVSACCLGKKVQRLSSEQILSYHYWFLFFLAFFYWSSCLLSLFHRPSQRLSPNLPYVSGPRSPSALGMAPVTLVATVVGHDCLVDNRHDWSAATTSVSLTIYLYGVLTVTNNHMFDLTRFRFMEQKFKLFKFNIESA